MAYVGACCSNCAANMGATGAGQYLETIDDEPAPGEGGRHDWDCACSPELGPCADHAPRD
jgi:hypothetical protein